MTYTSISYSSSQTHALFLDDGSTLERFMYFLSVAKRRCGDLTGDNTDVGKSEDGMGQCSVAQLRLLIHSHF